MQAPDHRPWAAWLFALLTVPAVMAAAGIRPNEVGAESAADGPGFEIGRLLDEGYYREIDDRAERVLAVRGTGLWVRATVDYELFNDSTAPDLVTTGADGWLFWREYQSIDCEALGSITLPATPGVGADQTRFVVTTPKAALHPEPLADLRSCEAESRERWTDAAVRDERYIDVNGPLESVRRADPEDEVFYRRDTHWSPQGRLVVAEAIVEGLSPGLWDSSAAEPTVGTPFEQRLHRAIGITSTVTLPDHQVRRSGEMEVVADELLGPSERVRRRWESRVSGVEVVPGTTLLVGDSQLNFIVPYLAPYFERLVFVHWDAIGAESDLRAHNPDRLLVTSIEASAARRFASAAFEAALDSLDQQSG